jgi:hypothetical protein
LLILFDVFDLHRQLRSVVQHVHPTGDDAASVRLPVALQHMFHLQQLQHLRRVGCNASLVSRIDLPDVQRESANDYGY